MYSGQRSISSNELKTAAADAAASTVVIQEGRLAAPAPAAASISVRAPGRSLLALFFGNELHASHVSRCSCVHARELTAAVELTAHACRVMAAIFVHLADHCFPDRASDVIAVAAAAALLMATCYCASVHSDVSHCVNAVELCLNDGRVVARCKHCVIITPSVR